MVYAIVSAVLLLLAAGYFLYPRKIIRLKKLRIERMGGEYIWQKINAEIKIFNKMNIIMPAKRGVPLLYIEWLCKLHADPRIKIKSQDGIERLIYLYAGANLYANSRDELIKRQLLKNCMYVFGVHDKKTLRPLKPIYKNVFAVFQPKFKYLGGNAFPRIIQREKGIRFAESYIVKKEGGALIKYFIDKSMPVECYEIRGQYRFTYCFDRSKMECGISHTSDTFYCVKNGAAAVYVHGAKVNFENSLTEKTDDLKVYVNLKNGGKLFIIHADTKQEIIGIIAKLRQNGGRVHYLQTYEEADRTHEIEALYSRAYFARYVFGEKLKDRYVHACRLVPTLYLPTLVYDIGDPTELFEVIDKFDMFKQIARTGTGLNVLIIYSSQNEVVREYIQAFTSKKSVKALIQNGIFLFFADRIKAPNEAVYYFSKMLEGIGHHKSVPAKSVLHEFDGFCIAARKNVSYCITNLRTGVTKYHKLLPGARVYDEFGRLIECGKEVICEKVFVCEKEYKTAAARTLGAGLTKHKKNSKISS